ncbi:hypothetical protein ACFY12_18030 [Streptomyces sp. NPDC001339]|uniref:hypothetical protein n=1 Tax=Streptomyces sp. NPDC001339 TaxID=3364563 RepID=UPI0036C48F53
MAVRRRRRTKGTRRGGAAVVLGALAVLLLTIITGTTTTAAAEAAVRTDGGPTVRLSKEEAGKGGSITVTGRGWRPKALLTLLICGQNMIGGTNSCANGDGRAVTTDANGAFHKSLPVAEPPKPCPCVVHVSTVTGAAAAVDAAFQVAGHPVAPLPKESTGGRLAVLSPPRLTGSSGLLTWFGAPPQRELTVTIGNLGPTPAKDPVFHVGTSHGVFAPQWEERQWRGTVLAGRKAEVRLPVELAAGAHGDYLVSLKYGGKVLAEQPWGVARPWGVTLFWGLLCLVVPMAVFRVGMAIVNRVRPNRRAAGGAGHGAAARTAGGSAALPWFTPDAAPSATPSPPSTPSPSSAASPPSTPTERPTSKGSA